MYKKKEFLLIKLYEYGDWGLGIGDRGIGEMGFGP